MYRLLIVSLIIFFLATPSIAGQSTTKKNNNIGKWRMSSVVDPMNDEKEYHLSLNADEGTNKFGKPISMMFFCSEKGIGMVMQWNEYVAGDNTDVMMRFDKHDALNYYCMVTSEHKGAYFADGVVNDLLRQISKSNKLTTQVNPYLASSLIAVFDVRKFGIALDRLKNKCPLIDLKEPDAIPADSP